MTDNALFEPYTLGALTLANRIVMAPLTRNRAGAGFVPGELAAKYYAQRATAGLIISEGAQVSQQGQGYQDTPGIYTHAQIDGWRKVTDAVHSKGGHIFLQLWHVGRVSHVDLQPNGQTPVAPSAIKPETKVFVNNSFADVSEPRGLELHEIPGINADFRRSAANAFLRQLKAIKAWGQQAPQDLGSVKIPVLIANGDNDIMVPTMNSADMARRIPGSQLVIYKDAGHGGIFQNHADFVPKALSFLDA